MSRYVYPEHGKSLTISPLVLRRVCLAAALISFSLACLAQNDHDENIAAPYFPPACKPPKPLKGSQQIKLLDRKMKETGLEYTVTETYFFQKNSSSNATLVTPLTLYDKTNTPGDKRVAVCATGKSVDLLDPKSTDTFKHMTIKMIQEAANANKITCQIPKEQKMPGVKFRYGAMGCQLVTVPAGKSTNFQFVSGNDRTIPVFKDELPVPGEFTVVSGFGGIGPTQNGVCPASPAAGGDWGQVGGHPKLSVTTDMPVLKVLDILYLLFIYFTDKELTLVTDGNAAPDRGVGTNFNCNKCFGMGKLDNSNGKTNLRKFAGYWLEEPLDLAKTLGDKAVFAPLQKIKYSDLTLQGGPSRMNLSLDDDYSLADHGNMVVTYSLEARDLPPQCAISVGPFEQGQPISLVPEVDQLNVTVSCATPPLSDMHGQLAFTVFDANTNEVLWRQFVDVYAQ